MRQRTVLVVDDNEDTRIVYGTMLRHHGYRVLEAADGIEAVRLTHAELPDLVLMDVALPGMDGWEATRQLKQDPATQHILIIALTAHALQVDREHAIEVGCDAYLAKPVEPQRVVQEVRARIGPPDA